MNWPENTSKNKDMNRDSNYYNNLFPHVASTRFLMVEWLHPVATSENIFLLMRQILKRGIKYGTLLERRYPTVSEDSLLQEFEYTRKCKEKLAMLYCQSGSVRKAAKLLKDLGCNHRLSGHVLDYQPAKSLSVDTGSSAYVRYFDDVLDLKSLKVMQSFFASKSNFWEYHNYNEYGNTGYFSYLYNFQHQPRNFIESVIQHIFSIVKREHPEKSKKIRMAEWWAHCRPHHMGHQFHFDSENEGQGELRHPLLSSVLYLDAACGGPTIVTNQSLGGQLADKGWSVYPKTNRLALFDAQYLHGVVPGKGLIENPANRRITFMIGFWDSITVRTEAGFGASRMCPREGANWINEIDLNKHTPSFTTYKGSTGYGLKIGSVWQKANGENLKDYNLPRYDSCFQGF
jgi:hypothetical protein